jgi:1-acyl-sn-glycerol-3-phosphate acyltransferase
MIKKIVSLIVFFVLVFSIANTITLGSYIFGKETDGANVSKDMILSIIPYIYTYGFNSKILYEGNYNKTDKVDIVISNHINCIDFGIYLSLVRLFDHRPVYFVFKKTIILIPGGGLILGGGKDIKMNRKLEDDIENITKAINDIKEGIIVIMPEGTRFTPEKLKLAQEYSKENNLQIFNNILYPKMKGLFIISNILKNNNRLGNIIDFTIEIKNFPKQKIHLKNLLMKNLGDSYSIINTYNIPDNVLNNYDIFKDWFITNIWIKKDLLLDNIQNINKHTYKEFVPSMKGYEYFILIICVTLFLYLSLHTAGLFIPVSFIISYYIMYKVFTKLKTN